LQKHAWFFYGFVLTVLGWGGYAALHHGDIPHGKTYNAVGAIIALVPYDDPSPGGPKVAQAVRAIVRTPDDVFFEITFRGQAQPPGFANAIGALVYHECGYQSGRQVYCFDSFHMTGKGVQPLDQNGKPVDVTIPAPAPSVKHN
jgi:hypothetical protein